VLGVAAEEVPELVAWRRMAPGHRLAAHEAAHAQASRLPLTPDLFDVSDGGQHGLEW